VLMPLPGKHYYIPALSREVSHDMAADETATAW